MRIVAGAFRGRILVAPKGQSTRPTADRVRQALFDVLETASWSRLPGGKIIDLFAGSGALGLEALSRGAATCLFIESGAPARAAIERNIAVLGLAGRAAVVAGDATRLPPGDPCDLAFLDPPYGEDLAGPALAALAKAGRLAPGALAVVELAAGGAAPQASGFTRLDERTWGAACVHFLRFSP